METMEAEQAMEVEQCFALLFNVNDCCSHYENRGTEVGTDIGQCL